MALPIRARIYIGVVSLVAAGSVAATYLQISPLWGSNFVNALLIFSVLSFLTEIYEVELVYKRAISTGIAICLAVVILGGAPLAVSVTLLGTLSAEVLLRWGKLTEGLGNYILRISFNTGQLILSTIAASIAFSSLGGQPLLIMLEEAKQSLVFYDQIIPAIGAFVAFALVNNALVSGIITITQRTSLLYHLKFNLRYLIVQILSLGVLGVLMAVVYAQSAWNLILVSTSPCATT
jgi:hypothetical protein